MEAERVRAIFADVRLLYADALEELERGKLRNAAEKAWGATKRATDALALARTGVEPEKSPATAAALREMAMQDPAVRPLVGRYYSRQGSRCMGNVFIWAYAIRRPTRNGASGRPLTTSGTPPGWPGISGPVVLSAHLALSIRSS